MSKRLTGAIRILRIKKTDNIKAIYAKARKAFSAEDLQRYTEIEKGVSADELLARMDATQREEDRKRRNRRKKA